MKIQGCTHDANPRILELNYLIDHKKKENNINNRNLLQGL